MLHEADHGRVTDAVAAAEAATAGEIVTIVARTSDRYVDVAWAVAGLSALGALAFHIAFPFVVDGLAGAIGGGWETPPRVVHDWLLFGLVTVKFLAARLLLQWMPLRLLFVLPGLKRARVAARAEELFRVGAERRTRGATGILVYLSLAEHRAEILADRAIAEKVEPEAWGEAMAALLDRVRAGDIAAGMAAAVEQVGALLAAHFPKGDDNPNELPDRLIEL